MEGNALNFGLSEILNNDQRQKKHKSLKSKWLELRKELSVSSKKDSVTNRYCEEIDDILAYFKT